MPDAWYLDAVLHGDTVRGGSAEATSLWDTSGTDDGIDLLANAVAGQPLAKAIHSSLSEWVTA